MGLLEILFKSNNKEKISYRNVDGRESFDEVAYNKFNEQKSLEFCSRNDLSTVEGIMSIPVSEAKRFSDGGSSVVYMPEQILNRKATEYKKEKKYDLAIACLKKANELYEPSFYAYTRDDYERLVNMMVDAGMYDEARQVHKKLDDTVGTYLNMLYKLKETTSNSQKEKDNYQKTIIDKRISEEHDREIYYYLLEKNPNIAPKSFGGFKKMKNSNSENYRKIINYLEMDGIAIQDIKFWIS